MENENISASQVLFPVALLSLALVIFFGFQTSLMVNDRSTLTETRKQQDKQIEQVGKVKAQANALAIGTLKLSEQGDKYARNIIDQLKKAGIDVQEQPAAAPGAVGAPVPAAPATAPAMQPKP
jgi:cellobiose-specific phosphotransferase system component IIB